MPRHFSLFLATLFPIATLAAMEQTNVLLVVADDWGYGHAGSYGCNWIKTPAFDRVAREGLLFTRAFTPNGKCAPSRSCILTGRNPWQLGAAINHVPFFPKEFTTFPESLLKLGWQVGMTGKGWGPGVAMDLKGNPRQMCGTPYLDRKATPPTACMSTIDYTANFSVFLESSSKNRPWFFWYGGQEPHRPYEYGSGVAKGGKMLSDLDRVPGCWPDEVTVRNDMLDYALEVEYFDRHLGNMLDILERSGQLDRTLVIVTSDNGMPFPRAKGSAYTMSNRLPLAIRWPAGIVGHGLVIDDPVSIVDIAPTIMTAVNIPWKETTMAQTSGHSWNFIFAAGRSGLVGKSSENILLGRERNDVGRPNDVGYPIRGIIQGDLVLLKNYEPSRWPACDPESGYLDTDGGPTKTRILQLRRSGGNSFFWNLCFGKRAELELYDFIKDPDCLQNLALDPRCKTKAIELSSIMESALKSEGDLRMIGQGSIYDSMPPARDARFYDRLRSGEPLKANWISEGDAEPSP